MDCMIDLKAVGADGVIETAFPRYERGEPTCDTRTGGICSPPVCRTGGLAGQVLSAAWIPASRSLSSNGLLR